MSYRNLMSSGSFLSYSLPCFAAETETGSDTFKWVTTTAVDKFKKNVELSKPERIAGYLRAMANEDRDTPIELTDERIIALAMSTPAEEGEKHSDHEHRLLSILIQDNDTAVTDDSEAEADAEGEQPDTDADASDDNDNDADADNDAGDDKPASVSSVDVRAEPAADVKSFARQVASKLATSEEFLRELKADMDAGEKVKRAPLVLMLIVRKLYSNEEMAGWPIPNTTWKEKHNNPDKRQISQRDPESGEWKNKTVGFYDLVFSNLPEGNKLDNDIRAIQKRKTDNNSTWRALDDNHANSEKKAREARRTSGRTLLRRAVALHMQFEAVKNSLPEIKCTYMLVKDTKTGKQVPTNSTYPILIRETKPSQTEGDGEAAPRGTTASVTQFLGFKVSDALDPVKVKEKGSVYDAFIGSSGKGSQDDDADNKETAKKMDVESAVDMLGLFSHWTDVSGNVDQLRKRMRADVHVMQSVCRAALELHPLYLQFKAPFDAAEAGDEARANALLANRAKAEQAKPAKPAPAKPALAKAS